jgi:putative solute:sodium symporter small subunit
VLLLIWFLVGPVLGILLVEPLNEVQLGGIPLGFWISQQGSIYVFILLIFAYAFMGDRLDRETPDLSAPGAGPNAPRVGGVDAPSAGPGGPTEGEG